MTVSTYGGESNAKKAARVLAIDTQQKRQAT